MSDRLLQLKSEQFWKNAKNTYLASADYYDKQEASLRSILDSIGPVMRIGDVGCGDGRFTLVALEYTKEAVIGFDFSPLLIALANDRLSAIERKADVTFAVGSFAELAVAGPFDIVMCLGVLSAVIEDSYFESAIAGLSEAVAPNGTLVTKDTLTKGDRFVSEQGEYVAVYRNEKSYLDSFALQGFRKIGHTELIRATLETSNSIYLFKKVS